MTRLSVGWILLLTMTIAALAGCAPVSPAAAPGIGGAETTGEADTSDARLVVLVPGAAQEAIQEWVSENYSGQAIEVVSQPDPQQIPDVIVGISNYFPADPHAMASDAALQYSVDVWTEPQQAAHVLASEIGQGLASDVVPELGAPEASFVLNPQQYQIVQFATPAPGRRFICCSLAPLNPFCTPECQETPPLTLNVAGEEERTMLEDELTERGINVPVVIATDAEVMSTENEIRVSRDLIENLPPTLPDIIEAAGGN